ncbi:MAG: hypothetical protein JZD40_00165, partial [Sulfolobus sp.]|nr:hypothetical protein [Sulfolobus sp.]
MPKLLTFLGGSNYTVEACVSTIVRAMESFKIDSVTLFVSSWANPLVDNVKAKVREAIKMDVD